MKRRWQSSINRFRVMMAMKIWKEVQLITLEVALEERDDLLMMP